MKAHIPIRMKWPILAGGMLLTSAAFGQDATQAAQPASPMTSEPLFWVLLVVALILLYVIYAMSEMVIWGVKRKMEQKKQAGGSGMAAIALLLTGLFSSTTAHAQEAATTVAASPSFWSDPYLPFYLLISVEVIVIAWLSVVLYGLLKPEKELAPYVERPSALTRIWAVINPTVPVEREDEIKLDDHEYDGIVELGNKMPPWLQFLFYVTILFAVVYAPYYLLGYGKTMDEKYQNEMQIAQLVKEERMKNSLNSMDENTVVVMDNSEVIAAGKEIFTTYCVACHGSAGEGGVGPNMTDQYWLHGGSINDIFRTVKYGVPEKGMASWQEILLPKQISEVANYILTLQGTNPPNAMPPQGDLYTPEAENAATGTDTTVVTTDTTSVALNTF